jgi:dCMP deaminase
MHSEANAISHATRSLEGSRAYVTLFPCNECAKLIASQKVSEVVYLSDKYDGTSEIRISKKIFELSGIKFRQIQMPSTLVEDLKTYLIGMLPPI